MSEHRDVRADEYRDKGWWRDRTLLDDFLAHAAAHPDRIAVVGHRADAPPVRLTYGELAATVDRWAAALVAAAVRPGDLVSFQLPNRWQFVALHLACARVGAVTNAILPILREREVRFICERLGSKLCVVPATFRGHDHAAMMSAIAAGLPEPPRVFAIDADGPLSPGVEPFEPFFDADRPPVVDVDARRPGADDVAQIQFTSGTTGEPKGVVHTWNTVHAGMRIVPDTMGLGEGDTVLAVSPIAHTVGFYFGVTMPMSCGMTVVLQDVWDPRVMAALVHEHGATWTMVAPTFLADLCAALPAGGLPPGFRFSTAGAPIPPPVVARVRERFGARVFAVWGMTEVGAVATTRVETTNRPPLAATERRCRGTTSGSSTRSGPRSRPGSSGGCWCAGRASSPVTTAAPTSTPTRSRTAGSTPATSPDSCPTAASGSAAAPRTS
jgi:cyclohexanecarboxylate-CoA ligase